MNLTSSILMLKAILDSDSFSIIRSNKRSLISGFVMICFDCARYLLASLRSSLIIRIFVLYFQDLIHENHPLSYPLL